MEDSGDAEIDLLYELGSIRHINRTWSIFGGVPFANVAEHTLRVLWISVLIARHEGADMNRVLKIALVHDVAEIRTGDVNYVSRLYTKSSESEAVRDSLRNTVLASEFLELWNEYKARETLEAKIVKDADNLDCDLELNEQRANGRTIASALWETRQAVFASLYTHTAKRLFSAIYDTNPHRWHMTANNRLTAGDWKPK